MPHRVQVPPSHAEKSEVTSSVVDIVKANISCTLKKKKKKKKREREREGEREKEKKKRPHHGNARQEKVKKKNE